MRNLLSFVFLFAFTASCASGEYTRPGFAPMVQPQYVLETVVNPRTNQLERRAVIDPASGRPIIVPGTTRPRMVKTGNGFSNVKLSYLTAGDLSHLVQTDANANLTNAEGYAMLEYGRTIGSYNDYIQNMGATNGLASRMEELEEKVDDAGEHNAKSDCLSEGRSFEDCMGDEAPPAASAPSTGKPAVAATPTATPAVPQAAAVPQTSPSAMIVAPVASAVPIAPPPVAPAPAIVPAPVASVSAPAPQAAPTNGGYFLQFKAQVMFAREKEQLASALGKAAAHAVTDEARAYLEAEARKVMKADRAVFAIMKEEYVGGLEDFRPLID